MYGAVSKEVKRCLKGLAASIFFLSFFVHISLESVLLCNMVGKFSGVLVRLICAIFRKVKKSVGFSTIFIGSFDVYS